MTDPPPKKFGSLRDRIAAFENKGSAPAPAPAPVPRPKPGHVAWQPKPASPPASPNAKRDVDEGGGGKKPGGSMSAADAKESIGKLSLKERMAALQGTAAFGGPAAGPPPPRPTGEKPKWKPPPVVQRVEPIGGEEEDEKLVPPSDEPSAVVKSDEEVISPAAAEEQNSVGDDGEGEDEAKDEGEPDPEEEERQRRAALAARMARLGGARVGMGPPIFGKKPDIPPKRLSKSEEKPKEEEKPKDEEKPKEEHAAGPAEVIVESPPAQGPASIPLPPSTGSTPAGSLDYAEPPKESADAANLSPESSTSTAPPRSPHMPVPQVPKRAGPPRKRPPKSPSPAPPVFGGELQESPMPIAPKDQTETPETPEKTDDSRTTEAAESAAHRGDREPEVTESQIEDVVKRVVAQVPEPAKAEAGKDVVPSSEALSTVPQEGSVSEPSKPVVEELSAEVPAIEAETEEPELAKPADDLEQQGEEERVSEPEPQHQEERVSEHGLQLEERVAEPEPQDEKHIAEPEPELHAEQQAAAPEVPAEEEEDEAARRKRIAERLAKSGGFNPFAGGMAPPPPVRRESADSARSPLSPVRRGSQQEEGARSPPLLPTSPKPSLPERKSSVGSVRSAESGVESPTRRLSLDVGAQAPPRALEQILSPSQTRELHEEPIEEAYEDDEAEMAARVEHVAGHDPQRYLAHEYTDDKQDIRGIVEEPENIVEDEGEPVVLPPPPPPSTRPPPAIFHVEPEETDEETFIQAPPPVRNFPPPPPRRASVQVPPPPRAAEESEEEAHKPGEAEEAYARHARDIGPEHEVEQDYEEGSQYSEEHEYIRGLEESPEGQSNPDEYIPPPPPRHAAVPPPPPPVHVEAKEEDEEPLQPPPPPPPRVPSRGNSLNVPPPPSQTHAAPRYEEDQLSDEPEQDEEAEELIPPPPRYTRPISQVPTFPPVTATNKPVLPPLRGSSLEGEVLDDSDVDPIDPGFYSPQRSTGSSLPATSPRASAFSLPSPPHPPQRLVSPPITEVSLPPPRPARVVSPPLPPPPPPQRVVSPPLPPPPAEQDASHIVTSPHPVSVVHPSVEPSIPEQHEAKEDEDGEQARRRTIAERMAKLGGIRFGAPPPVPAVRRPPPPEAEAEKEESEEKPAEAEEAAPEEEEDEFARKQRIAARIAGMGGMRLGMLPGAAPPKAPPKVHHEEEEEEESIRSPPPPKRSAPVPPPPPPPPAEEQEEESDYQHVSDSDGAGHEESELEEVTHSDAEEEAPPPVPDRSARRVSTGPPPVPQTRPLSPPAFASAPPVPRTRPPAPPAFTYPPRPHVVPVPSTHETQGDFVVVEQPESIDEPPPPPPPRSARPPPRAPPRTPPPAPESGEAADSQWETPAIPSIDFGGETDLSLSGQWSEDSTTYPPAPPQPVEPVETEEPPPPPPARPTPVHPSPVERNLTSDELTVHWGRVGVQVHEIAAALFEKSKKSLVGDGSYIGFVNAVIGQVPNAAQPTGSLESFGYLCYSQSASAVQRRVSDIMPGDVVVISEAKFKGHKGLQSYNQNVGIGEPVIGIIGDFEAKKSKVKVYQANQHVGHQSVESVSYRLEDLKNGTVKIYRVLEA